MGSINDSSDNIYITYLVRGHGFLEPIKAEQGRTLARVALRPMRTQLDALAGVLQRLLELVLAHVGGRAIAVKDMFIHDVVVRNDGPRICADRIVESPSFHCHVAFFL